MAGERTTIAASLLEPGMILGNGMPILGVTKRNSGRIVTYTFATALGARTATVAGIDSITILK